MFCFCAPAIPRAASWRKQFLTSLGRPKLKAFSAGSHPAGQRQPSGVGTARKESSFHQTGLRSKDWNEFLPAGRAVHALRVYGMRPSGGGGVPGLARPNR